MKDITKIRPVLSACSLLIIVSSSAHAEQRQLDSHEHGKAILNLAIENGTVIAEFEAPGVDIVGFEHPAETDGQTSAIRSALRKLNSARAILEIETSAQCVSGKSEAELHGDHIAHDHDDHDDHDKKAEKTHTEFHASYAWKCANITSDTTVAITYFDGFPNSGNLQLNLAGDYGQTSVTFSKPTSEFTFGSLK